MSEEFYLTPEKERDWRRRRYWRLKEKGVCTCCGQERSDGTNLCARCKETQRRSHEILRQERIKKNLCRRCGTPLPDTKPSHPLADYAGTYEAPGYRRVLILCEDGKLTLDFNHFTTTMRLGRCLRRESTCCSRRRHWCWPCPHRSCRPPRSSRDRTPRC